MTVKDIIPNIDEIPLLSHEEELGLVERIQSGDKEAIESFKKHNLRFVAAVAKQYPNRGLTIDALLEAGQEGLIKAAMKYDKSNNLRVMAYAVWWIRQSILQALAEKEQS